MAAETRRRADPDGEDDFSYASLVNRWRRERATTTLTRMDDRFYEAFDAHLQRLHSDYQREHAVSPAAPKVLILLDELTNLQRIRDDLYDLREKKIATAAILAAREGRPERQNMTRDEEAVFESVLRVLAEARRSLLRKAAAEPPKLPAGPPAPPDAAPAPASAAQPAALLDRATPSPPITERPLEAPAGMPVARTMQVVEQVRAGDEETGARANHGRILVRVTQNVEPFVAPDLRHYHLAAEDVAALPRDVAHLLVSRGLAVALSG